MTKARDLNDSTKANWTAILTTMIVLGLVVIFCLSGYNATQTWAKSVGGALFLAGVSLTVGGFLGFLFGIPQAQAEIVQDAQSNTQLRSYKENTNLEQISDWLTKIIVGLTLVQFNEVEARVTAAGKAFGPFLVADSAGSTLGETLATGAILYFLLTGFLFAYLWTRINLEYILRSTSALWNRDISSIVEDELQGAIERNVALLETVETYLDARSRADDPAFANLQEQIKEASYGTRTEIYQLARRARVDNKRSATPEGRAVIKKTETIFRGLVEASPDQYPENYSQLARAIIFSERPDWGEAIGYLEQALTLKGSKASEDSSTHMYLGIALIEDDANFKAGKKTDAVTAARIKKSLAIAALGRTLEKHPVITKWMAQNSDPATDG